MPHFRTLKTYVRQFFSKKRLLRLFAFVLVFVLTAATVEQFEPKPQNLLAATTCPTSGNNVTIAAACVYEPGTYVFTGTLQIDATVTIDSYVSAGVNGNISLISDNIIVNGTLNGNGFGFPVGQGTSPGVSASSGAAHGGYGGNSNNTVQTIYGSVSQPTTLGSGGSAASGQPGGAAVRLQATGTITVNGAINMNGTNGAVSSFSLGSGGSAYLKANTITGAGSVSANGGTNSVAGAGGGGGRIAFEYVTNTSTISASATGGSSTTLQRRGGAGTIYYKNSSTGAAGLVISNGSVVGGNTTPANSNETLSTLTVSNGATYVIPSGITTTLSSGAAFTGSGTSAVTVSAGGVLALPSTQTVSGLTTLTNSGSVTGISNLTIGSMTWAQLGTIPSLASLTVNSGGTYSIGSNSAQNITTLTVNSGGVVTHEVNPASPVYQASINAATITVNAGGSIHANAKGYPSANGPGAGGNQTIAIRGGGGGGYGGAGSNGASGLGSADSGGNGGGTYGSSTDPVNHGSAGGGNSGVGGGVGGGIVKLVTTNLTNDGTIAANGGAGIAANVGGGGAGGSINITVNGTWAGSGTMTANGGAASLSQAGCGGGGRIVVNYGTKTSGTTPQALGWTTPCVAVAANGTVSQSALNPVPTTTSISPTTKFVGDATFTLTVNGTGFVNGASTVRFNGSNRTTTFVSSTQLTASIPASDLNTTGSKSITVINAAPGGGTSNAQTLTVEYALPTTTSVSPDVKTAGDAQFTLTVNGTGFVSGGVSTVRWNGANRATTFVSSTQLTATILAGDVATAGSGSVTVFNTSPGGGTSNAQTVTVNNPTPAITTISPDTKIVGDAQFTLTVTGTGFVNAGQSVVHVDGSPRATTYVNPTTLTAVIPDTDIATTGNRAITVVSSGPGGGTSNSVNLSVENPVPVISSLSPSSATEGDTGFAMSVFGTDFVTGSVVRWEGSDLATTYVSDTELTATVPTGNLAADGAFDVTVFNPAPGGGESLASTFTVNPFVAGDPTITSLTPNSAIVGAAAFTLTVTGTQFDGTSVVEWDGSPRATTFISATELEAAILATDVDTAGMFDVTVTKDAANESNAQTFTVNNPVPTITSVVPSSEIVGSGDLLVTVNGTNFVGASVVRWEGGDRATAFVSDTELSVTVTAADLSMTGMFNFTVFNPGPGGDTSNAAVFTVENPAPVASSLSPDNAVAGSGAFTLTVNGSNFVSASVVRWEGVDRATTYISDTQLEAAVLAGDIALAGLYAVTVVTQTPGGGTSGSLTFTANNPVPAISALTPTDVLAGASDFTLTIDGTNFVAGSVVRFDGADRATTFVSSTQVTTDVTAAEVDTADTITVTVFNAAPGGGESNGVDFLVNNPVPTVSALTPDNANEDSGAFTLTVTGTNFVAGSTVRWNGSDRATTFVSGTQLTASILAGDLATDGLRNVSVRNDAPGGGTSNDQVFTINNVGGGGGGPSPQPPTAPVAGTGTALNGTTIRWAFTDHAADELGFEIIDMGNASVAVATTRPLGAPNVSYLDETGLTPGATYCNRAVTAYNAAGTSSINSLQMYACVSTPAAPEPEPEPPVEPAPPMQMADAVTVTDQDGESVTLRLSDAYVSAAGSAFAALRDRLSNRYVCPVAGQAYYQLVLASCSQPAANWPVNIEIRGLTDDTDFDFELYQSPSAGGAETYVDHVEAETENRAISFSVVKSYLGQTVDGDVTTLQYRVVMTHTGNVTAHDVILEDLIPYNTEYHPGSMTDGGVAMTDASDGDAALYDAAQRRGRWTWATFAPGTSHTVTIRLDYEGELNQSIVSTATATCSDDECAVYGCGDGVRQSNEVCDDGAQNGDTGMCDALCGGDTPPLPPPAPPAPPDEEPDAPAPSAPPASGGSGSSGGSGIAGGSGSASGGSGSAGPGETPDPGAGSGSGSETPDPGAGSGSGETPDPGAGSGGTAEPGTGGAGSVPETPEPEPEPSAPVVLPGPLLPQGIIEAVLSTETQDSTIEVVGDDDERASGDAGSASAPIILAPGNSETARETVYTDDASPTFIGSTSPGSSVLLYVDGRRTLEVRADETGRYTVTVPNDLPRGPHTVEAVIIPREVEEVTETISTGTAVIAGVNAVSAAGLVNVFGFIFLAFTQPTLLLDRKKRRPYGIVFNSLSRIPVDLAIVRLYDAKTNRILQTKITDAKGRYNFFVRPGDYKFMVIKPGFDFPSKYPPNVLGDIEYTDVLTTPEVHVAEEGLLAKSIPVDPKDKQTTPAVIQVRRLKRVLQHAVAVSSSVIAVGALLVSPSWLTAIIAVVQITLYLAFLALLRRRRPKSMGTVRDESGHAMSKVVVRIFEQHFNKLLETQVTDRRGRYAFLVGKGQYMVTASQEGYETASSGVIGTEEGDKHGLVAPDLVLKKAFEGSTEQKPTP